MRRFSQFNTYIVVLLFTALCYGQEPAYTIFNAKNGLLGNSFRQILQGSRGNLWIATDQGVAKYNGYYFKNFDSDLGIDDEQIVALQPLKNGDMAAISINGSLYKISNDSVIPFSNNQLLRKQITHLMKVCSMAVDEGDTIWIGVNNADFYLKLIPINSSYSIKKIKIISKGFIGLKGKKYFFSINNQALNNDVQVLGNGYNFSFGVKEKIKTLSAYKTLNQLLIGCNHFIIEAKNLHQIDLYDNINQLFIDENNRLWVLFENLGLARGDLNTPNDLRVLIKNVDFLCFYRDYEGGTWLGSYDKGLFYIPDFGVSIINQEKGLEDEQISTVLSSSDGLYFGTNSGRVYVFSGNRVKPLFNLNTSSILQNQINSLFKDPEGNLWIGAIHGAYVAPSKSNSFLPVLHNGKPLNNVKSFVLNKKNNGIWVAAEGSLGLAQLQSNHVEYKDYPIHFKINAIEIDTSNNLWLGCNNGLWKYNERFFKFFGYSNKWLKGKITSLKFDENNTLWVGTHLKGIITLKGNIIKHLTTQNGLADNEITHILVEGSRVIIATPKGVSFITDRTIKSRNLKTGLVSEQINKIALFENKLVCATPRGLMFVSQPEYPKNIQIPTTYISSLLINDSKFPFQDNQEIILKHFQNNIEIQFAAASFKNMGKTLYRYKLLGYNDSWKYTYSTLLRFLKLNDGKYQLQIQAQNSEGKWGNDLPQIKFTIKAPFYEKPWFLLLSAFIIAGTSAKIVNWQLRKKHLKELRQEALKRRLIQLELQALRAQMNPHFIFNSINSIQHFILGNNTAEAHRYLSKFAKLMRNVLENSKSSQIPLEKELQTVELYMQLESLRFEEHFDYEIIVDPEVDMGYTEIPSMLIQPYIENAIWHGLMHKQGRGKITVTLSKMEEKLIKCSIEDNGIGRKKAQEYKSKNKIAHKSVGMMITKERLQILNNINSSNLNVEVFDLENHNGEALGTKVDIFIPIN